MPYGFLLQVCGKRPQTLITVFFEGMFLIDNPHQKIMQLLSTFKDERSCMHTKA
jgi:hypothetical protein